MSRIHGNKPRRGWGRLLSETDPGIFECLLSLFGYFGKTQHIKLLGSRPGLTAKRKKTYISIILVSLKGLQEA